VAEQQEEKKLKVPFSLEPPVVGGWWMVVAVG